MAESAGADLLTVVRRLLGLLSCSENSAGGGWSRQKQLDGRFLWSHQSGQAGPREGICTCTLYMRG